MILITAIVMLIGISGYLVLSNDNIKQQLIGKLPFNIPGGGAASDKGSVALPSGNDQSIDRQQPWIDIVNASPGKTYNLSDPIILYVDVSSGGQDITGYDALLTFDKAYFDLVEVSSALPNFQIFKFDNKNHISVTGIKDINDRTQSIFDNTHLLKLTLKPKQKGTSKVGIVTNVGREVTQLVDVNVAVIKPQAGSEEITVN